MLNPTGCNGFQYIFVPEIIIDHPYPGIQHSIQACPHATCICSSANLNGSGKWTLVPSRPDCSSDAPTIDTCLSTGQLKYPRQLKQNTHRHTSCTRVNLALNHQCFIQQKLANRRPKTQNLTTVRAAVHWPLCAAQWKTQPIAKSLLCEVSGHAKDLMLKERNPGSNWKSVDKFCSEHGKTRQQQMGD